MFLRPGEKSGRSDGAGRVVGVVVGVVGLIVVVLVVALCGGGADEYDTGKSKGTSKKM